MLLVRGDGREAVSNLFRLRTDLYDMSRSARLSFPPGRFSTDFIRTDLAARVARAAAWLFVALAACTATGCSSLDGAVDSHRRSTYDRTIQHVHVATSVSPDLVSFRDHLAEACIRSLAAHDVAVETSALDWSPPRVEQPKADVPLPFDRARREGATSLLVLAETSRGIAERAHRSPGWGYAEPSVEQVVVLDARLYDLSAEDSATGDRRPVWSARVTTRSHPLEAADEAALTTAAQLTSALQADGLLSPLVTYRD